MNPPLAETGTRKLTTKYKGGRSTDGEVEKLQRQSDEGRGEIEAVQGTIDVGRQ